MVALVNESALRDLIVGSVVESSDIRKYAVQYKADITAQAEQGADAATISQNLYNRLSSEGAQVDTFDVESIYAQNKDGDFNANVWASAKQIDNATKVKLRKVRPRFMLCILLRAAVLTMCRSAASASNKISDPEGGNSRRRSR
jgi:hypothetical protein